MSWQRPRKQHNSDKNQFKLKASGMLPSIRAFFDVRQRFGGESHEKRYRCSSA
jgi:hypothetical protein